MGEIGHVEVHAHVPLLGEVNPAAEVLHIVVPALLGALGLGVHTLQAQTVGAGGELHGLGQILPQLVAVAGGAGIVACDGILGMDVFKGFEALDVITGPAVDGNADLLEVSQGLFRVHSIGRKQFLGALIILQDGFFIGNIQIEHSFFTDAWANAPRKLPFSKS